MGYGGFRRIHAHSCLSAGYSLILLGLNAPMSTQTWLNTIDKTSPTSHVVQLPSTETAATFTVSWTGTDVGAGVRDYTIYVSDNGGAFIAWQTNTTATSASFRGQVGHTYAFYSIARDLTGNVEAAKTTAETSTQVTAAVNQIIPTMTVTPSSKSITKKQALNVVVTVNGGGANPTPTGSVTLTGGSYTSVPTALVAGSATISIAAGSLATGSDTLTATYTPDSSSSSTYNSASATASVTVTTAAISSFTISDTAVTFVAGATTGNASTVSVIPSGGFTGSVALTAAITGSPTGAQNLPTFSFGTTTPVSITSATAGTATLTISTTASSTTPCNAANQMPRGFPWQTGGRAILACMLLFGIGGRRCRCRTMLGMIAFLGAMTCGVLACGGGAPCTPVVKPGTTAGTYTITVTGTSGTLTPTGTVTLTMQ